MELVLVPAVSRLGIAAMGASDGAPFLILPDLNKHRSKSADVTTGWRASEIVVARGDVGLRHLGTRKQSRHLVDCVDVGPWALCLGAVYLVVHQIIKAFVSPFLVERHWNVALPNPASGLNRESWERVNNNGLSARGRSGFRPSVCRISQFVA